MQRGGAFVVAPIDRIHAAAVMEVQFASLCKCGPSHVTSIPAGLEHARDRLCSVQRELGAWEDSAVPGIAAA